MDDQNKLSSFNVPSNSPFDTSCSETNALEEISSKLNYILKMENDLPRVMVIFGRLKTNTLRVDLVYKLLREYDLLPKLSLDGKNSQKSEQYRQRGNEMFKKQKAREAHEFYTKSIAFAEPGKEAAALAYANRSAVLFEKKLYEECLSDIELAFQNSYPEKLKPKLIARQSKARELLPHGEKIEFNLPIPSIPKANKNPKIDAAADCIEIQYSEKFGRHIVATRDIKPGEVIVVEKSFCPVLIDQIYTHCHHCLKLCYTLIACARCTEALFCSLTCQKDAEKSYHQYECPILLTIKDMNLIRWLYSIRVTIIAREKYSQLDKCVLDKDGIYRSDRYDEIYNLVTNISSKSSQYHFNMAVFVAIFFHLLKSSTTFFEGQNDKFQGTFKELLFVHIHSQLANSHQIVEEISLSDKTFEIGMGVFSFLSLFNHSCCPNIMRTSYAPLVTALAIGVIKKGEQCFDNYGPEYDRVPKADRQAILKERYCFDCACEACTNDYPLYDSLPLINNLIKYRIPIADAAKLRAGDLKEAKRICKEILWKIGKFGNRKINQNMIELQDHLGLCHCIFRAKKSPIS